MNPIIYPLGITALVGTGLFFLRSKPRIATIITSPPPPAGLSEIAGAKFVADLKTFWLAANPALPSRAMPNCSPAALPKNLPLNVVWLYTDDPETGGGNDFTIDWIGYSSATDEIFASLIWNSAVRLGTSPEPIPNQRILVRDRSKALDVKEEIQVSGSCK